MKLQNLFLVFPVFLISGCMTTNYKHLGNALSPNMTKQEVISILGYPDYKRIDGKKESYCYAAKCGYYNSRSIQVDFDENGLLRKAG